VILAIIGAALPAATPLLKGLKAPFTRLDKIPIETPKVNAVQVIASKDTHSSISTLHHAARTGASKNSGTLIGAICYSHWDWHLSPGALTR
jgi:hypothetical protein